jgi:hypothetical protein
MIYLKRGASQGSKSNGNSDYLAASFTHSTIELDRFLRHFDPR